MAAPDANLAGLRGSSDVNPNHMPNSPSSRQLHNFNTFQYVSQLVSATPPYLFNMSSPFPGNFFSDLLRRMAPRAGIPGIPPDATLQQQIRAALLAKGGPLPPTIPPTAIPSPLDLAAAAAAAHGRHHVPPTPTSASEKSLKRSLFTDVSALSSCDDDSGSKRPRLEESRASEERLSHPPPLAHPSDALTSPFLMQSPFLHSAVPNPHDVLMPWSARASMLRQVPIPTHIPPAPLDPYRLLLDLRLAGQLRSMATSHLMNTKDVLHNSIFGNQSPSALTSTLASSSQPVNSSRGSPVDGKLSDEPLSASSSLFRSDERVSAFHPPGKLNEQQNDVTDEDVRERRCSSESSSASNGGTGRDGMGPQYILRHLTQIYRSIDGKRSDEDSSTFFDDKKTSSSPGKQVLPGYVNGHQEENPVVKRPIEQENLHSPK